MSMREYAVDDYGLLLDSAAMKILASKVCGDYTDEDYTVDEYAFNEEVTDKLDILYISEFVGEAFYIHNDGTTDYSHSDVYNDDIIYYCGIMQMPRLFGSVYESMDEVIAEFKGELSEYLPDDFDYRGRLRHICGTYFG